MRVDATRVKIVVVSMQRVHVLALPYDLRYLIQCHLAAYVIQTRLRIRMYRHVHRNEWQVLRKLLAAHLSVHEFDEIGRNGGVRREWRSEPASWIYELHRNASFLPIVLDETRHGLWM